MTLTEEALAFILAKRDSEAEPELEALLSINDFIQRIQGAAKQAHAAARHGVIAAEREYWTDIGAIACARIEYLLTLEEPIAP